jgi:hypothetical protein
MLATAAATTPPPEMRPALRTVVSLVATVATVAAGVSDANADPQGTAALTIGVAGVGLERRVWDETAFHLGAHGDVLFGRESNADFGVGPYAEVLTHAFDELQFGGGLSVLFPVSDTLPIVASLGAYGRAGEPNGLEPGVAMHLFWGSRSYNFHSSYVMSAGLMGQARIGLGSSEEIAIVLGAQLDFLAMSLPFVFLASALRGGSPDTAPVTPSR